MVEKIKIRQGGKNDLQQTCELLIHTWQTSQKDFIPKAFLDQISLPQQLRRYKNYLAQKASLYVAALGQNQILGFILCGKNRITALPCEIEIYALYVSHTQQGKGLGAQLLAHAISDLQLNTIAVSVFEQNPYKAFYEKQGFTKEGEESVELAEATLIVGNYVKTLPV